MSQLVMMIVANISITLDILPLSIKSPADEEIVASVNCAPMIMTSIISSLSYRLLQTVSQSTLASHLLQSGNAARGALQSSIRLYPWSLVRSDCLPIFQYFDR